MHPALGEKALRLPALDGLRGLASLVVLITHVFNALHLPVATRLAVAHSPLALLLSSSAAVQLFFVLSGLVLAASLDRSSPGLRGRASFLAKRVLRIHPPYVFAVLFAWCASFFYVPPPREISQGLSGLMANVHLSPEALLSTLLFPSAARLQLPVGWTLTVEMIFSLAFPVLSFVARRTHWLVLVVAAVVALFTFEFPHPLRYGLDFAVGISLYIERARIGAVLERIGRVGRAGVFAAGLCLLAAPVALVQTPTLGILSTAETAPHLVAVAVGASLLVASATSMPGVGRALSTRLMQWLGRISFSLYLVHYTLLLLLSPFIERPTDAWGAATAFVLVGGASLLVADLAYRAIERPSIRAGRAVAALIDPRDG